MTKKKIIIIIILIEHLPYVRLCFELHEIGTIITDKLGLEPKFNAVPRLPYYAKPALLKVI